MGVSEGGGEGEMRVGVRVSEGGVGVRVGWG